MALLGIFWYNTWTRQLEGVYSDYEYNILPNADGTQFFPYLHRDIWDQQHAEVLDQYGNPKSEYADSIFINDDYTLVPRGRISADDSGYQLYVGSWIYEEYDYVFSLIVETFKLPEDELEVIIDRHWELGHGWSE